MTDPDQIASQLELLNTHRATLHALLLGAAQGNQQPGTLVGIAQARAEIARLKTLLRGWGEAVDDQPDDAAPAAVPATQRLRVMLSYKRDAQPDEGLARAVADALRPQHTVFLDQDDIPVGSAWAPQIAAALRDCDALIVLLSAAAVSSEMVRAEIAAAHRLAQTSGGRPRILPVRVAYRTPFQYPLSAYLDPLNWAVWDAEPHTPRLIASLAGALAGGTLPIDEAAKPEALDLSAPLPTLVAPTAQAQPGPPVRPADLELPEGTMATESAFYIARPTDALALQTIGRTGVTLTIKGPRQMGKSSLLMRVIAAAQQTGKRVAFLDFQLIDAAALQSADLFFRQFCVWLADTLELPDTTADFWGKGLGQAQTCTRFVQRALLPAVGGPLLLALDEVESIFEAPFRSDFFGMLRAWHNSRATSPVWKPLDLALVTSTEPYQLIDNLNQSPFNVGQIVDLEDFRAAQVADLAARHGLTLDPATVEQLTALLGGHPYLTRRALYVLATGQIAVADLFAQASAERGPFGDHLRYHLFRLTGHDDLIAALRQVLRSQTCPDEALFWRLRGAGLVKRAGAATLPRCQLYAAFFGQHLR